MHLSEIVILEGQQVKRDFDSYKSIITASFPKSWREHNVEVCLVVGLDITKSDKLLSFSLVYKGEVLATITLRRRRLRAVKEDVIEEAYLKCSQDYNVDAAFARIDSQLAEQAMQAERSKVIYDFVMKEFNVDAWTARQYLSQAWPYMPEEEKK